MSCVGFDISALDEGFKAHAHRGIGRYVGALQRYFASLPKDSSSLSIREFSHRQLLGGSFTEKCVEALPCGRQTIRQQLIYPYSLTRGRLRDVDVLHFPAHLDAPSWCPTPYVVTVLDLIPLVLSDMYRAERASWRFTLGRWLECKAIKNASMIIAISENTAQDVVKILGVPREKIAVTPLGVDERFFLIPELSAEEEQRRRLAVGLESERSFILYVGGIDQRKNWQALISIFSEVVRAEREKGHVTPTLVMAGRISDDAQFPKLIKCIDEYGVKDQVLLPGFISDEDLLPLYAMCNVFFFPSLYEGFGLTPLEALAAGAPVVSSNRSSMPEVLQGGAVLVDPDDKAACVREILGILHTPLSRQEYRERGRAHARRFTWENTGARTIAAYECLLKDKKKR